MKDEGPYILEWLAYHRAIGFTDFLIYTNDCSDGTDLLLDRLQNNGIVTHVRNKVLKRGPHKSALKYAKDHSLYAGADWVYVCDADEFLNIKIANGHVEDLVARFADADAIPVAWRLFSHNSHLTQFPGLCTEIFTDAQPQQAKAGAKGRFVKTLFKPSSSIGRLALHAPIYKKAHADKVMWGAIWQENDPESSPDRPMSDFGYEVAQVNHYAVRSIDAFLLKLDRSGAHQIDAAHGVDYWRQYCTGGTHDTSIQRHAKAMQAEYNHLCADPVVAHLHHGAIEYQQQQLKRLRKIESFETFRNQLIALSGLDKQPAPVIPGTDALKIKAPKRHANRLRMLAQMPKYGRCAEIGVWNGGFSRAILDVTQPKELTLIDPWDLLSDQGKDEWTHKKHKNHQIMRGMFDQVTARYGGLPNVSIRKGFSAEVLETFEDDYFDWLYIDGNHLYEFVRQDVEVAFRKVRPGGVIAGDDYYWKKDGKMHVKEAVLDAMRAQGLHQRPNRIAQQYMITVPDKKPTQQNKAKEYKIGMLWVEGPLSFLEQLCIVSFLDAGQHVRLYVYKDVPNVPKGVEVCDARDILATEEFITHARTGSVALHSDKFRYRMLAKHPDIIWADTDAYCVRPFTTENGHFHGWAAPNEINCGVLRLPAQGKVLANLIKLTDDDYSIPPWLPKGEIKELQAAKDAGHPKHAGEMEWGIWGPRALTWALHHHGQAQYALPQSALYPVPYKNRRMMGNPGKQLDHFFDDDTYSIHFWGRRMRAFLMERYNGIPPCDSLIGQLVKMHGIDVKSAPLIRKT